MTVAVTHTDDPAVVLATAGGFLASRPVHHNLVLSLLHQRVADPTPGHYWVASDAGAIVGVAVQSPTHFPATLTPMPVPAVRAVVGAIAELGVDLPGLGGDAATAAAFTGEWTERRGAGAVPFNGQRIYECAEVVSPSSVPGAARLAGPDDRRTLLAWVRAFFDEVGEPGGDDAEAAVDQRLPAGHFRVWEVDGDVVSMAARTDPVAGVSRVQAVFTPPDRRARGYAAACVAALTTHVLAQGDRCILYTDLANPTSNGVYRAIGYRAVAEGLRYRFG